MKISIHAKVLALMLLIFLANGASGVRFNVIAGENGNSVSATTNFAAQTDAKVSSAGSVMFSSLGLTQTTSGAGDFTDSRRVSNKAGSYAEEGVNLRNSASYTYTYTLTPGEGGGWSSPEVSAGESLDVQNANYIKAYAKSGNAKGYKASTSTEISDPSNTASLLGYTNNAVANSNGVSAGQSAYGIIGVASVSASAKDKNGKEAKSAASFIGDYSFDQHVSIDKSSALASQSLNGLGYFEGGATSAKDGKGKEAVAMEDATYSGVMNKNMQHASVDASGSHASQEVQFAYQPTQYTGVGDWEVSFIFGKFTTSAKDKSGRVASTEEDVDHGEDFHCIDASASTGSGAGSSVNSDAIAVVSTTVDAKDKTGKEAKSSVESYTGVYSNLQSAAIDKSSALASFSLEGVGYFSGATTSAKDGKDDRAIANEYGAFSGNLIDNRQDVSAGASGGHATQSAEMEYMPISYQTGTYDTLIGIDFTTSTKDNVYREATAEQDVKYGEHLKHYQSASTDEMSAKASNDDNVIGVASGSVLAKDNIRGKEAKSLDGYTGVYSSEQSASTDKSSTQAGLDLKGVGYFTGATTSAKDGKKKEAVADEHGGYSGNMIANSQSASIVSGKSHASQEAELEYNPVSYMIFNNDASWLTFSSWAKANGILNPVKEEKKGVYVNYIVNQDISAP